MDLVGQRQGAQSQISKEHPRGNDSSIDEHRNARIEEEAERGQIPAGPAGRSSELFHEEHDANPDGEARDHPTPEPPSGRDSAASEDSPHVDLEKAPTVGLEKAPTVGSRRSNHPSVLARVLSHAISRPSAGDPGPPPDGGTRAWLQVFIAHLAIMNTWGYIQSYGVFQTYYVATLGRRPADIAWVGSVQIFLLFFVGTFSGRATDAGYFRPVFLAGSLLQMLSVFATSGATQYWQLFLSHGICSGLANGLMFCSLMSVLSSYFARNRAVALSLIACGTSTGGMLYPAMVETLLPRIGFGWTVRAIGLVMLVLQTVAVLGARPRLPPRLTGPLIETAALTEAPFMLFAVGMFLALWSWFIAFYYVGSFARDALGADAAWADDLLLIMNGLGIPGRMIPAVLADRATGPMNLLVGVSAATAVLLFAWTAVADLSGLLAFTVLYGLFASGILGLFPPTVSSMTTDISKTGVRLGMTFTIVSFACLTGPPIGGALIERGGYVVAQVFAGAVMILAAAFLLAARLSRTGWKWKVRI